MPRVESILLREAGSAAPVAVFEPRQATGVIMGHVSSWTTRESEMPQGYDAWIDISGTDLESLAPGSVLKVGSVPVVTITRPEGIPTRHSAGRTGAEGQARPGDVAAFDAGSAHRAAVLTLSDSCSRGEREDGSGRALVGMLASAGMQVVRYAVMADGRRPVAARLASWCDDGSCDLVLTTGGTGFSPTDETPEATSDVIERHAQGLVEMIRYKSSSLAATSWLSRAVAGIRNRTLVVNLPGSVKAATESCSFLLEVLPHALEVLAGRAGRCGG